MESRPVQGGALVPPPLLSRGGDGSDEGPVLDARRLRALYQDLLGRPPLTLERARWAGRPQVELRRALLGGPEFWSNWLEEQLYYFLLVDAFRPESERVLALPEELAAGRVGARGALHAIALSASFDRRNPGPDTFVTVVMEQLVGLDVQGHARELDVGKRVYDGATGTFLGERGRSQADVVRIAIEDRRCLEHLLVREHRRLLRAEPDPAELRTWVARLEERDQALVEVLGDWLASPAWEERLEREVPIPNRAFVRALFVDLCDRLPAPEEERRLRSALDALADAGPLRAIVARQLLDSGSVELPRREDVQDPTTWIAGWFERLLGRSATAEELTTFVRAFREPACRPATVVQAIVTHPEYQTY